MSTNAERPARKPSRMTARAERPSRRFTDRLRRKAPALAALAAALAAAATFARPAHAVEGPLVLTGWTLVDFEGDWAYSNPSPTTGLLQETSGSSSVEPGWVVSGLTLESTAAVAFTLKVQAGTGDDDIIGFAFSYLDNDHFHLLDWKRQTQSFNWGDDVVINDDVAEQGIKIKRIDGGWTLDGLWGGKDGLGVTEIAGPAGGGWVAGSAYQFVLELSPGRIVVKRDGSLLFDIDDPSYPGGAGAIALYGFSQNNIELSDVFVTNGPACPADFDGSGAVDGSDLGQMLAAWGGGDPAFDLDGSGTVDGADLGLLLSAWGACP